MNSLEDKHIIDKLYAASQAGVKIDLLVRGVCCLRPAQKFSENIRVLSFLGRFLEHSRIFYFRNGAEDPQQGKFFISSADWMTRNLHQRLELAAPLDERWQRERIWEILAVMLNDYQQSWQMNPDGSYAKRTPGAKAKPHPGTHQALMEFARASVNQFKFSSS